MADRSEVFAWMAARAAERGSRAASAGQASKHFGISAGTIKSWISRHGDPRKEGAPKSKAAARVGPVSKGTSPLALNLGDEDPSLMLTEEEIAARRSHLLAGREWTSPLVPDLVAHLIRLEQDLARAWRMERGASLVGRLQGLRGQALVDLRQAQAAELVKERSGTRLAPPPPDADVLEILAYQIERTRWQLALAEANESLVAAQKLSQKEHDLLVEFRDIAADRKAREQVSEDERVDRLAKAIKRWPDSVRAKLLAKLAGP